MFLWAGIDEAGYGPLLGPLVVAGTCFKTAARPSEGFLWDLLSDSLTGSTRKLAGRVAVADSKSLYSRKKGLKNLEETLLSFERCLGRSPDNAGKFLSSLCPDLPESKIPWFCETGNIKLPVATNRASIESKSAALNASFKAADVALTASCLWPVLPEDYNRMVARTNNKSMVLWQKCGLILQRFWRQCRGCEGFVLVDRHGGRLHYRKLLKDAFPQCRCDVNREGDEGSVYRLADGQRVMWVAFKQKADQRALPVSLASMTAKYVRELYMLAFNSYWGEKIDGLRPTAGYAADARRFLRDIRPVTEQINFDLNGLVRLK